MPVVVQTRALAEPEATAHGLDELYVRHAPAAFRTAYFLTGDRDLAEDLVQDAFVRVAGRFRHLRAPQAFDAYLRRTIVNLFTSHLRRLRLEREELRRRASEVQPLIDHLDPPVDDELWSRVRTLPERQRAAIVLRFYEDLSERETAEILGCSAGAVNSLVAHAMATLRGQMEGER
jgi:RNA polymerase sigma-70 factor (sigma-E family)